MTAYNSELSNDTFPVKCQKLSFSHLDLNKYFMGFTEWNKDKIETRSERLYEIALKVWGYFGHNSNSSEDINGVSFTKPVSLTILGQKYPVKSWADLLEQTTKTIADLAPEKLEILINTYPRFINRKKELLGISSRSAEISEGVFINKNYSSESIRRFCTQAMETIELSSDDWVVKFN